MLIFVLLLAYVLRITEKMQLTLYGALQKSMQQIFFFWLSKSEIQNATFYAHLLLSILNISDKS